jgi:hypothetical protein
MASSKPRRLATVVSLAACIGVIDARITYAQNPSDSLLTRAVAAAETVDAEAQPLAAPQRPAPLVGLYVSLAALQALDITSTRRAIHAGAAEANPMMAPFASSTLALAILKAGATGATIVASERLWKKNRKAALLTMIVLNGAYSAVVARNYRIASARRGLE